MGLTKKPRLPENMQACVEELAANTFEAFKRHNLTPTQGLSCLYVMVEATERRARTDNAKDDDLMGAEMFGRAIIDVWNKAAR